MLLLSATVACSGASVLVLEILGSRLMAPVYGTTLYVWSSLIAVTMFALSLGYAAGGRLADRCPPLPALYRILAAAGWLVLFIPLLRVPLLTGTVKLGLGVGGLAAALLLLGPSLVLLGCVAPLAAKAAVAGLGELGGRVGGLYALSTIGSLAGALATGFLLIPFAGVTRVLLFAALLLFLPAFVFWMGAPRTAERRFWRALTVFGMLACLLWSLHRTSYPVTRGGGFSVLHKTDGPYGEIKVVQYSSVRLLLIDGTLQTALEVRSHLPLFPYAAAIEGLLYAAHPGARDVLLVGLGGGILAEAFRSEGSRVTAVEIDPAVAAAARRFFTGPGDLPVVLEDGRTFLARTSPASWDAVVLDAYAGEAPPPHLLTREFYSQVRRALRPGGTGVANLISFSKGPEARLARCLGRTIGAVFPWVEAYAVEDTDGATNVIFVFSDSPHAIRRLANVKFLTVNEKQVTGLLGRRVDLSGPDGFVFTDEFCPTERLSLGARAAMRRHLIQLFKPWVLLE